VELGGWVRAISSNTSIGPLQFKRVQRGADLHGARGGAGGGGAAVAELADGEPRLLLPQAGGRDDGRGTPASPSSVTRPRGGNSARLFALRGSELRSSSIVQTASTLRCIYCVVWIPSWITYFRRLCPRRLPRPPPPFLPSTHGQRVTLRGGEFLHLVGVRLHARVHHRRLRPRHRRHPRQRLHRLPEGPEGVDSPGRGFFTTTLENPSMARSRVLRGRPVLLDGCNSQVQCNLQTTVYVLW